MNLKQTFLILFIIGLIGGSPIILNRIQYEKSNSTYEIAVDMQSSISLEEDDLDKFYKDIKTQDISTIVFSNMNLYYLSEYRDIEYMTVKEYRDNYEVKDFLTKNKNKNHIVIKVGKDDFLTKEIDVIKQYLNGYKSIENNNEIFFYIDLPIRIDKKDSKVLNPILTSEFFIDNKAIQTASDKGFIPMIAVTNEDEEKTQDIIVNQIIDLSKEYKIDKVQLRELEVIGHAKNTSKYLEKFKDNGISLITTEFQTKKGLNAYLENGVGNVIRGHEISVNSLNLNEDELGSRIARAVKERNMRLIILKNFIDYSSHKKIDSSVKEVLNSVKSAKSQLNNSFKLGIAKPIPVMDRHMISEISIAISASSMVGLLYLSLLKDKTKAVIISGIVLIGAIATIVLQINIAIKLYALFIAITGAVSAIIIPWKSKINSIAIKYLSSAVLSISAGIMVACIMYGTSYMTKLQAFSGVKALYVLPPLLVAIWVLIDKKVINIKSIKNLNSYIKKIKWYHYASIVIVVLVGVIYVRRSGNAGSATELELYLRMMLEKVLYARPRTKEFMLGYPMLLAGYYLYKKKFKYSQFIIILGAIGTMSTVNTFTHFHTPFLYSMLRSVYGVIFGAIVGLIYIVIFNTIKKFTKGA